MQSIFMILAQVRTILVELYLEFSAQPFLACPSLYLHHISPQNKPGSTRRVNPPPIILAMANLHSIHRIFSWFHVSCLFGLIIRLLNGPFKSLSSYTLSYLEPLWNICFYTGFCCARTWKHIAHSAAHQVGLIFSIHHYPGVLKINIVTIDNVLCTVSGCRRLSGGQEETLSSLYFLSSRYPSFTIIMKHLGPSTFSSNSRLYSLKCALSFNYQLIVVRILFYVCHPRSRGFLAAIVVQRLMYGNPPPETAYLNDEDELEEALALASW